MKKIVILGALSALVLLSSFACSRKGAGDFTMTNERMTAEFDQLGLISLTDSVLKKTVLFEGDGFALHMGDADIGSESLTPTNIEFVEGNLVYSYTLSAWDIRVIYELKQGWGFVSKRIEIENPDQPDFRIDEIVPLRTRVAKPAIEELLFNKGAWGALLRFAKEGGSSSSGPDMSMFILLQNPFMVWRREDRDVAVSYQPQMDWKEDYGPFSSDRVCIGLSGLGGTRYPAKAVPEWAFVTDMDKHFAQNGWIDAAENEAIVECVRSFLLYRPAKSVRIHVPWCENDYQIDVATAGGWEEYQRIIDRAVELGCQDTLFTPANSALSSLSENRDAWGWENVLFFGLGQKIRKGEWFPGRDPVPASLQKMLDYAKAKKIKFISYSYPSLAFLQNPEWTRWAGDKVGGYSGADTGLRSFQDWWINTLVNFLKATDAGGFSFDHWWLSYVKASSKYAQWFGCTRILENLRSMLPDIVIDGRQQYMSFGPWTWLAGNYPHPTTTDEQPESFAAFPDLHTDRVSADRQRFAAWMYRIERFCPPEIMPGFITHQTERTDAKKVMRRDRFRPRDWDVLGWKYSVLSSIAAAPFNHVVNVIPARDPDEYRLFSEEDKRWFRKWLSWTDENADVLKNVRPIIGQPMLGRVDGTAAFKSDRGFIFLFNPNYRAMNAEFALDASIGLKEGTSFVVREIHPEEGMLIGKPGAGFWNRGDRVVLPMRGAEAVVLEVAAAPKETAEPLLFNAAGKAAVDGDRLVVTDVSAEPGTERKLEVLLPKKSSVKTMQVNGKDVPLATNQKVLSSNIRFSGEPFTRCQPLWTYDPNFAGGAVKATVKIPGRVFDQLRKRREAWPVPYTEDDLLATWLGSYRLLLYVQIAEADDSLAVGMTVDGKPVALKKAYNSIYGHSPKRTFLGFYADVSSLGPDKEHVVELTLPQLAPGRFQGLFFENVEPEYTKDIAK